MDSAFAFASRSSLFLAAALATASCSSSSKPPPAPDTNLPVDAGNGGNDAATATHADAGDDAGDGGSESGGGSFVATSVAVGKQHACAITFEGGVRCWGDNSFGQLGDGTTVTQRSTPVAVSGLSGVVALAAGDEHTCALDSNGAVHCWGTNLSGALGDATNVTQRNTPALVSSLSTGVMSISAGGASSCALLATGVTVCWGDNRSGQLGNNSTTNRNIPGAVVGVLGDVVMGPGTIAVAADHTCLVASGGNVMCSGDESDGALGNGGNASTMSFVSSGVMGDGVAVSAGVSVSCAVIDDGSVQCWGFGGRGEIGNGDLGGTDMPETVDDSTGLSGVSSVSVGGTHVCAITSTGALFCWGGNTVGEVGDGTLMQQNLPVPLPGLASGVVSVSAGGGTCAVTSAGAVLCWGPNTYGQVGDGTTDERDTPAAVVGFP